MFRRLPNRLPPDVSFPTNLKELGYFITQKDQIRQMANPDKKYQYKINRNDRVNDVYKEAMNTSNRQIVRQRLLDIGLQELRLPLGATQDEKHVPILISPDLATKKHVIVIFTERHIDLGILSYRILGDEGVNTGSIVNLVKSILESPSPPAGRPGLVIANPSQLIWYRGGGRAVTDREWSCLPRESAVHSAMRIDEVKNRIEGNRNFEEHIRYLFEHVLSSPDTDDKQDLNTICNPEAKFSIIGLEYPGSTALQYLVHNWTGWRSRISSLVLCNPQHTLKELFSEVPNTTGHNEIMEEITTFIAARTRAYRVSRKPVETLLSVRNNLGCNVYSSGEALYEESVFVRCWPSILDWIDLCRFSESYTEPIHEVEIESDAEIERTTKWPTTEAETEAARFHGTLDVNVDDDTGELNK